MLVVMLILGLVGFGLGWYKGHMIWQPDPKESRLIKTPKIIVQVQRNLCNRALYLAYNCLHLPFCGQTYLSVRKVDIPAYLGVCLHS